MLPLKAFGAYSNYNSVVIGQEAAGFGGAYTALSGDASAVAFYNPASMARMKGSSLSASASAFQKFDTQYGDENNFLIAPTRVNKGFFEPVPSAAGSVVTYQDFSFGFSILIPDFNTFSGEIESSTNATSFLSQSDQTLWVGGSFALNLSPSTSVGVSLYYTARKFQRSLSDQLKNGTDVEATIEEKNFTQNSVVFILGLYHQLTSNWSAGLSLRLPSIPISGSGTFFRSDLDTNPDTFSEFTKTDLLSATKIPLKLALGIAYQKTKHYSVDLDVSFYGRERYEDVDLSSSADLIEHEPVVNFAIGGEYCFRPWLTGRTGFFTNFSSHPKITAADTQRRGDHLNMLGTAANLTFHTSVNTRFTFGGYWTGGRGESIQQIGQNLSAIGKSVQIFTMVVGTSYQF